MRFVFPLLAGAICLVVASSCAPFSAEGQSCEDAPCAVGLVCVDLICATPTPEPVIVPDCVVDDDCTLNGSADGRECVEGECRFIDCVLDLQCGTRICDEGVCGERIPCNQDVECGGDLTCQEGVCRSPCSVDEDCAALPFNVCREGTCRQQCLGDFTCFGDICEDGVCLTPACDVDEDCDSANTACNGGRCEQYTPCTVDDECFDPDYRCNEIGRCEERPLCRTDDDCGASALCRQEHCRPVTTCLDDSACEPDDECVAGRCVGRLDCRSDVDCAEANVCENGACLAREEVAATSIVASTVHGDCTAKTPCELTLFVGESTTVGAVSLDAEAHPLSNAHALVADDAAVLTTAASPTGAHVITAVGPGDAVVSVTSTGGGAALNDAVFVHVLAAAAVPLRVLVIDQRTGGAIEGATVTAGSDEVTTDAAGVATFAIAPAPVGEPFVAAIADGYRGHVVIGLVPSGDIRMVLTPTGPAAADTAAGVRAKVTSSGDELGPVGIGIFLPAVARAQDARIDRLFGETFNGALEVPVLGTIPLPLRAAVSLEASLPIIGAQNAKDTSFAELNPGVTAGLALEGRFEQAALFDFVLGADATDVVLNLAQEGESLDAELVPLGDVVALPRVVDGDLADDVADIDNDGDINEVIPDWLAFDEIEISPTRSPRERVGLKVIDLPAGARARTLAIGGVSLPAFGFVPLGLAAPTVGETTSPGSQMRVVTPAGGLARGDRHVVVQALFDDTTLSSAVFAKGRGFAAAMDLGGFISPPSGAFFIDGVPTAQDRLLVLPQVGNATTFEADLVVGAAQWTAVVNFAISGGRSFALPPVLLTGPSSVGQVTALRLPGATSIAATTAAYRAGAGPYRSLDDRALAIARASTP